jgi:hypothetical protein
VLNIEEHHAAVRECKPEGPRKLLRDYTVKDASAPNRNGRHPGASETAARAPSLRYRRGAMTRRQTEATIAALAGVTAVNAFGGAVYGLSGARSEPSDE